MEENLEELLISKPVSPKKIIKKESSESKDESVDKK